MLNSLRLKIVVWALCTIVVAWLGFFGFTGWVLRRGGPVSIVEKLAKFEMNEAIVAYESGGEARLRDYIQRVNDVFPIGHHLTDASGKDLLTGEDLSSRLKSPDSPRWIALTPRPPIHPLTSPDAKYHWIVEGGPQPLSRFSLLPYFALVFVAVIAVCTILAAQIAEPIKRMTDVVGRFGRGDLHARIRSARRDEIGGLGEAFDQMGDRIQTLLVAERQLLQDISHELRSPLARLSFAAELARTAPDRGAAIDRLKREIDRLTSLVSSLIEVTRAEGDPMSGAKRHTDVSALVGEVVSDCRLDAEMRGCAITYTNGTRVTVDGNAELLRRAVENILRNAIRYAPPDSPIDVTLTATAQEALILVRDRGPGVPEDKLPRIFEPFYRADASRDASTGGVGLGLAIARRAVNVHHGRITAANAYPGLRVEIHLPSYSGSAAEG
jgi:two-component system sensor histidine kinase CpxA